MGETIKWVTLWLSTVTEGISALIIALAIAECMVRVLFLAARGAVAAPAVVSHRAKEEVRLRLGRWLALALEFLLAADILRTAVAPTWSEIGQLAAIAAIRTALNFFLQLEIDKAASRNPD